MNRIQITARLVGWLVAVQIMMIIFMIVTKSLDHGIFYLLTASFLCTLLIGSYALTKHIILHIAGRNKTPVKKPR